MRFFWQHIYPPEYEGHFESLLLDATQIRARVRELAALIHADYKGVRPVLLCTLVRRDFSVYAVYLPLPLAELMLALLISIPLTERCQSVLYPSLRRSARFSTGLRYGICASEFL